MPEASLKDEDEARIKLDEAVETSDETMLLSELLYNLTEVVLLESNNLQNHTTNPGKISRI